MLFPLIGCSGDGSTEIVYGDSDATEFAGVVPDFSGPWAAEFSRTYQRSDNEFTRSVLADGVITDQEVVEVQSRFISCLEPLGYTDIAFDQYGGMELTPPPESDSDEVIDDQVLKCSIESGEAYASALYYIIQRNPNNLDEHTIMAACLVNKGVVDPSYSADDYARDSDNFTFPYHDPALGDAARRSCNLDPLGIYG